MSLLVVGTVAFDAIETPFGKTDKIVGGAASYICLASSYFYKNINLVSVIGDDFDQKFLGILKAQGVDMEGLQVKKGEKYFFWAVPESRISRRRGERSAAAPESGTFALRVLGTPRI